MSKLTLNKPMDLLDPPHFNVTKHTTSGLTEVYQLSGKASGYGFSVVRGQVFDLALVENYKTVLDVTGTWSPVTDKIYALAKAGRLLDALPLLLDGRDSITGSTGNDGLGGYGGNDTIDGRGGNDRIMGGDGNDIITGGLGNDTIMAGKGDDVLHVGSGADVVDGSWGVDWLDVSGSVGVSVDLMRTDVQKLGTASLKLASIENLTGTEGRDRLFGTHASNRIDGDEGNDLIDGRRGDDVLIGGGGTDTLIGGYGRDRFVFFEGEGSTFINDFTDRFDKIHFLGTDRGYSDISIRDSGPDTLISFRGNTIRLENVDHKLITAADFSFDYV